MAELIEDQLEYVAQGYDNNWSEYTRYLSALDYEMKDTWQPIIWGCMMKEPLKDFFIHFDWDKPEDQQMIVPPCGEIPNEVKLVCYHAKRLQPEIIANELPQGAKKLYRERRTELLYGKDPLSVIEMFEVGL